MEIPATSTISQPPPIKVSPLKPNGYAWNASRCAWLQYHLSHVNTEGNSWGTAKLVEGYVQEHFPDQIAYFKKVAVAKHLQSKCCGVSARKKRQKTGRASARPSQSTAAAARSLEPPSVAPKKHNPTLRAHRVMHKKGYCSELLRIQKEILNGNSTPQTCYDFFTAVVNKAPSTSRWRDWSSVGAHLLYGSCNCSKLFRRQFPYR